MRRAGTPAPAGGTASTTTPWSRGTSATWRRTALAGSTPRLTTFPACSRRCVRCDSLQLPALDVLMYTLCASYLGFGGQGHSNP